MDKVPLAPELLVQLVLESIERTKKALKTCTNPDAYAEVSSTGFTQVHRILIGTDKRTKKLLALPVDQRPQVNPGTSTLLAGIQAAVNAHLPNLEGHSNPDSYSASGKVAFEYLLKVLEKKGK